MQFAKPCFDKLRLYSENSLMNSVEMETNEVYFSQYQSQI